MAVRRNGATSAHILAGLKAQIEAGVLNRGDQYTPHPTTWLNQGRWEDEIVPLGQAVSRSGRGPADDGSC